MSIDFIYAAQQLATLGLLMLASLAAMYLIAALIDLNASVRPTSHGSAGSPRGGEATTGAGRYTHPVFDCEARR